MSQAVRKTDLGTERTEVLLRRYAVPSIIAMLVSSLYNIVDQFFIGQAVGPLGNAATNIAFPLSISCVALALLFGIGGSAAFNISMGAGKTEKATQLLGNAITLLFGCGIVLALIAELSLKYLLQFFGSPDNVLQYAMTYTRITALGIPFLILATGGGHLLRADSRPRLTMLCNITGAVINTILDALFVFVFGWGMAGAAAATIIGQIISGSMAALFLSHCKTVRLHRRHLILKKEYVTRIASLGIAPFSNQVAMMIVQIVMNNSLKYYGARSIYGEAIPIACVGIITKVNMIFMSFIIGFSQGMQPISSFNFGAKQFDRVKRVYFQTCTAGAVLGIFFFTLFQIFPRQIISFFGSGSEEYYRFATNYFRIFLFFTFCNFIQPITSNFFTSISKAKVGAFLSLTRQIIFLLPLILIFPLNWGIDGIMYAGPVADFLAAVTNIFFVAKEMSRPEYRGTAAKAGPTDEDR